MSIWSELGNNLAEATFRHPLHCTHEAISMLNPEISPHLTVPSPVNYSQFCSTSNLLIILTLATQIPRNNLRNLKMLKIMDSNFYDG